jgi:acyl carrier protein
MSAAPAGTLARMTALWAEVFGVDPAEVDPEEGFFEAGGTSYQALTLATRTEEVFGVEVPLVTVLTEGSVAFLAEVVDQQRDQVLLDELDGLSDEDARKQLAKLTEGA